MQRERPARRLEDAAEDAPRAARQVLNHQQAPSTRAQCRGTAGRRSARTGKSGRDRRRTRSRRPPGRHHRPRSARERCASTSRRRARTSTFATTGPPAVAAAGFRRRRGCSRRRNRLIELRAAIRRHVVNRGPLAELQCADVGGDRPAVCDRHLRCVVRHRAESVRLHVEEIADRRGHGAAPRGTTVAHGTRVARPCRCPVRSDRGTERRTR